MLSSPDPFAQALAVLPAGSAAAAARQAWLAAGGLPTQAVESWKYTGLNALRRLSFDPFPADQGALSHALPDMPVLPGARRLLLVNGQFRPDLSDPLPDGLSFLTAAESEALLFGQDGPLAAHAASQPVPLLNAALGSGYCGLRVHRGARVETPVHLAFVSMGGAAPSAFHPRWALLAEADSDAVILEDHYGLAGEAVTLSTPLAALLVCERARLGHYKLQREPAGKGYHLSASGVRLLDGAFYDGFLLQAGARLARHEAWLTLAGRDADLRLGGAVLGDGERHLDNTVLIDHAAPASRSRMTFRSVLDGSARSVLQGRVLVRREAQGTDSHQSGRALLLSPGAEMDAKPELEIYADNVKCGHGAAAGNLDRDQLFYLRARGLPEAAARRLLVAGFLGEVIDGVGSVPVRQFLRQAAGVDL